MKKTVQVTALLFTSALLLAACGQDKKEETTVATTQEPTTQATTAAPTTVAQAKTEMPADAKKTVLEASDEAVKATMTLYYKDDVLLKQESVTAYIVSKMEGENPLETLKKSSASNEERLKEFIGKGFEFKTDYKDDVFTITYSFDYTKIDMKKLSFYQAYTLIGLIGFVIVVPCLYYFLGAERSYSILVDLFPYGTAYVAGLLYQKQLDLDNLSLYPLSIKERILPRVKRILLALLSSSILYTLFSGFLRRFHPLDLEILVVSLLVLFVLEETFLYQIENYKLSLVLGILFSAVVIGLRVVIPEILQLVIIALFIMGFCIFWMYYQTVRKKS